MNSYYFLGIIVVGLTLFGLWKSLKDFIWLYADVNDYIKFPALNVNTADEPFRFDDLPEKNFVGLDGAALISCGFRSAKTETAFSNCGTTAFIVIKNGGILQESYFNGYSAQSIMPSFSIAKTFVAALVGSAVMKGSIGSIDDPITHYIDFLPKKKVDTITIKDLLNMRSGILFKEQYTNPFANVAKLYYGRNLQKQVRKITIEDSPDKSFQYNSINTQLLGCVLEEATGKPLNILLEEMIWKPLGMEYPATWSIDSASSNTIKAFCCINARAIDFAKLGQLYLNKGQGARGRVFSEDWYDLSVQFETSMNYYRYRLGLWFYPHPENLTDSTDLSGQHIIWRDRKHNIERELVYKPSADFCAEGILGQFVYVDPKKKITIVRLGKKVGNVNWIKTFRHVAQCN